MNFLSIIILFGAFADEVNLIVQATLLKLRREVGMYGNAANKKITKNKKKQRAISNGSPATVSAADLTAAPPLPSHNRKQQHNKRQLGAASV